MQLGLGDSPIICFTGSLVETEGLSVLCAALEAVRKKGADFRLVVAGASLVANSEQPHALFRKHGLDGVAVFLGMLNQKDVIDLQAGADILVMPKTDHLVNHAGLGTKLSEYLCSGRAVIASKVGDVGLYLRDGIDAILVPPSDTSALEHAIVRLLDDPGLRARLGAAGRNAGCEHFGMRNNVDYLVRSLNREGVGCSNADTNREPNVSTKPTGRLNV
jgi:glycosyltransferase involved in cell wall biosynthesis